MYRIDLDTPLTLTLPLKNILYSDYATHYMLMMCMILWLGSQTLGFELVGFSNHQNLLVNFLWYVLLVVLIFCCPMIHRFTTELLFPKSSLAAKNFIANIRDESIKSTFVEYYEEYGKLPLNHIYNNALAILFCIWLFEVFFVYAWVKGVGVEKTLIWQPDWLQKVGVWISNNSHIEPFSHLDEPKLFIFGSAYAEYSASELLHKPIANATFVLHFFRLCFLLPIGACLSIVLWHFLFAYGASELEHKQKKGSVGGKIWVGLAMFVTLLGGCAFLSIYAIDMGESSMSLIDASEEYSYFWIGSIVLSVFAWGHAFIGLKLLCNFFVSTFSLFCDFMNHFRS